MCLNTGAMGPHVKRGWDFAQYVQLLVVGMVMGCVGAAPPIGDDAPPPGRITSPQLGALFFGDTAGIPLRVEGIYQNATSELAVQALVDPDDLTSWATLVTTQADAASNAFAVDLPPVARARWPLGGVFRLRVIDDDGVPLAVDDDRDGVLAIVNPGDPPQNWKYLVEKPVGTPDETALYYTTINAAPT